MTGNKKTRSIVVRGTAVGITRRGEDDFISLTDMLKAKDGDFFISDWLRTATPWSSSASGSAFTTLRSIMANSPQLKARRA